MKIVIICPHSARTGGPEALHQLSDALLDAGHDACLWYYTDDELDRISQIVSGNTRVPLPARQCIIDEYRHYRSQTYTAYDPNEAAVFVLPETLLHFAQLFQRHKAVVWWLSLDFGMGALSRINFNFLRASFVTHAAQSHYAYGVTKALGFKPEMLTDYTVVPPLNLPPIASRPKVVCVNVNHKVILNLNYLEEQLRAMVPDVEFVRVAGFQREQIYELFSLSRLYIDLGAFAGNDRMPREAAALGAQVIVSGTGAGADPQDYPLASLYRPDPFDLDNVAALAARLLLDPARYDGDFAPLRAKIAAEQQSFRAEVASLFARFR